MDPGSVLFVLVFVCSRAQHIDASSALLYPYGPTTNDQFLPFIDDFIATLHLTVNIPVFGRVFSTLYINSNGLLQLNYDASLQKPRDLPLTNGEAFIAPFWADMDLFKAGVMYYRQDTNVELLERATSDITSYFSNTTFSAQWVLVATWDKVASYYYDASQWNTFQVVLTTDGNFTFVLFNYIDINWPQNATSKEQSALAGLNSGSSRGFYELPQSLTSDILNLPQTSNVNVPGRWAFKVDKLIPEDVSGVIGR
ncbi:alpha-tectorin-like [Spea bombifrons]|uniref:alpha-tectorin-like n=1 Tax=Spea bombifrons TaxID=233779 RepID=UPI002349C291|nr:alpha-tectorin-like [Spea bombifrons]